MQIDAVIFDWGGTLTPWTGLDPHQPWEAYAEVYAPERSAPLARALAAAELRAWELARDHSRSGTIERILRAAGVEPTGADHLAGMDAYLSVWEPHTIIDPDVPPLLRRLRADGLRLGVLSNTFWPRAYHEQVFDRDGLLELFDGTVYSSEIPWTKPHPEAFRAARESVGCADPGRAVYVGDRLYDDMHGAKEAGMRTVFVPHSLIPDHQRGRVEGTPDATVQRLGEVADVVARWRGEN